MQPVNVDPGRPGHRQLRRQLVFNGHGNNPDFDVALSFEGDDRNATERMSQHVSPDQAAKPYFMSCSKKAVNPRLRQGPSTIQFVDGIRGEPASPLCSSPVRTVAKALDQPLTVATQA